MVLLMEKARSMTFKEHQQNVQNVTKITNSEMYSIYNFLPVRIQ